MVTYSVDISKIRFTTLINRISDLLSVYQESDLPSIHCSARGVTWAGYQSEVNMTKMTALGGGAAKVVQE